MSIQHATHSDAWDPACLDCLRLRDGGPIPYADTWSVSAPGTYRLLPPDPVRSVETCCELACYEDPGCACPGCVPDEPAHVTPVGGWLMIAFVFLVVIVAIVWRITRA